NSLIHAREPAGMEVLLYFMWHLLDNYGTDPLATYLVDNRELWFVPVVNPDGYCYNEYNDPDGGGMWRKNRRFCGTDFGIDLNRNWGYMWGYDDDGSSPYCDDPTYRGESPFSEPATQVIRDFMLSRNFVMSLDNHCHGDWLLIPWGYDYIYTPDHDLFRAIAESMAVFNGYTPATCWEAMYLVNGGSIDWEYGELGIIGISPEIGNSDDGFWPPEWRILPLCELNLQPNLLFAELAGNPYQILPPNSPVLTVMDTVPSDYTISWSHHDTLNPASLFELVEMTGFERTTYDVEGEYSDWELDGFSVSTDRSHSPTHSFYSGEDDRLNNTVTGTNNINVHPGDSLKIWCWYNIENNWDYAYVEISTNGGSSFFSIPGNITTDYNPNGNNLGNGITGYSNWVEGKFDLAGYVGQQIYLRLRYVTDGYVTEEGFYADDIYPVEGYESTVTLSDAIADTFYYVSGQAEGTYFYKVRAKDGDEQWGAWSNTEAAIVGSGGFMRGDANGDGTITVSDVVFLVNYLYRDGPAPDPLAAGDINSDGQINVGDIVYLVNYLFHGGPPPAN
ncbi:MAG: M14 family zinc carboxypeptidase, partial [Candidatus Zixiibacteriota bacterium]